MTHPPKECERCGPKIDEKTTSYCYAPNCNCPCHTPTGEGEYKDGCIPADNIGKGHTFLPGCEKYSPNASLSAPTDGGVRERGLIRENPKADYPWGDKKFPWGDRGGYSPREQAIQDELVSEVFIGGDIFMEFRKSYAQIISTRVCSALKDEINLARQALLSEIIGEVGKQKWPITGEENEIYTENAKMVNEVLDRVLLKLKDENS